MTIQLKTTLFGYCNPSTSITLKAMYALLWTAEVLQEFISFTVCVVASDFFNHLLLMENKKNAV